MSTGFGQKLATKLFLPHTRPDLVARPQLVEKIDQGLKGKLTVISAPAGFGKTSLMTAWKQQSEMPIAWYSLDEEDNKPEVFADYLIGALQTIDEGMGRETSAMLQNSPTPPLKVIFTSLLNEICESTTDFALALDDYHVISDFGIHEAVSYFIERLPPHAHVLIGTRSDPPFPLSRLRAGGDLKELRAVDLRFAREEAAAFLNDVMNLDLADDDVNALEARTEGWITGLKFCALSLQGSDRKSDFVKQFAGDDRYILDYLLEEILHRQPESLQNFLLRTSVLQRLTGSLCDALTGESDGYATLEHLNRSNLFLMPLDGKSSWFRYHHLFADLLRFKLLQKEPGRAAELQLTASRWCEENGLIEESINYALAAKDWSRALDLIEPNAYRLISVARFERVKHWAESIPTEALSQRPTACYWYVPPLLYSEEFDKAASYIDAIEKCEPEELRKTLLSAVWSSRCYIAIARAELDKCREYTRKAFEFLAPDDVIQHGVARHAVVAVSLLEGDMKASEALAIKALPVYRQANHFIFEVWGKTFLGFARMMQGHLADGEEKLHEALRYAKEHVPQRPDAQVLPNTFLCEIYRERDDLERARIHLDEALTLIQTAGRESFIILVVENLKSLASMMEITGEAKTADQLISDGLRRLKSYGDEVLTKQLEALKALLALRRGDAATAAAWTAACGLDLQGEVGYLNELQFVTYARWLLSGGRYEEALAVLERVRTAAERSSRTRTVIEVQILQALAHHALGDEKSAIEALEIALVLGRPDGCIRSFTDEGGAAAALLVTSLKQNGRRWETEKPDLIRYVVRLQEAFGQTAAVAKASKQKLDAAVLPWWYINDPLSDRELEVMQLVAQGLSNLEIANKIFISAGTVKRHLSNIYQKLDVHSRTQATERARKLQLLDSL